MKTKIFYRLNGELGSITVPASDTTGEMKRLARRGAIIRGVVRDYDSPEVEDAVVDGLLRDLNRTQAQPSEAVRAAFDAANVADRWDGGAL